MNRVGRLSLRFDAVYCAVGAASLILFLGPISHRLSVAPAVTAVIAVGVGGWAIVLYRIARRRRIRRWLIGVLVANLAAATLIAAYAAVKPWDGAFTVLLVAVSVEIAAFAASQAFALRSSSLVRRRPPNEGDTRRCDERQARTGRATRRRSAMSLSR